jgi:6-phosphogluconolactonase (cycloisomerase 2 family)
MLNRIRTGPRPPRARLCLEALEDRCVPAGLHPSDLAGPAVTTVYTESNNPTAGQNAVLAFRRNPADGSLHQIGAFLTGGTGTANPGQVIGPDDSDQEVVATRDGRFLFAVNQGSNSVTSFRIDPDGRLDRIGTFDSGGVEPVSLGLADDRLYVANRGDSAVGHPGTVAPDYTAFFIEDDGSLAPIPNSTVTFPVNTSPAQALISHDGRFLFADIFAVPGSSAARGNTIAPFQIESNGTLQLAPGGNVGAPVSPPLLLGTALHPKLTIIYAGLTGASGIGVFTYDDTGRTTFVTSVADQGKGPCWVTVSADGKYLYAANTGTDSVGVFSLADPLHPVEVQEFALGGPLAPPGAPAGTRDTAAFQLALDPSGRSLYVIGQSTSPTLSFPEGNQLHELKVAPDGTLSEPAGPILFPTAQVPANARPQGLAVVAGVADHDGERDEGSGPEASIPDAVPGRSSQNGGSFDPGPDALPPHHDHDPGA